MKKFKKFVGIIVAAALFASPVMTGSVPQAAAAKLVMNKKNIKMTEGSIYKLKVKKVTPKKAGKKVKYKTNNKKVAAVSKKGKIKAKKAGKAVITVTLKSNKKIKAKVKVTVTKKEGAAYTPDTFNTAKPDVTQQPQKETAQPYDIGSATSKPQKETAPPSDGQTDEPIQTPDTQTTDTPSSPGPTLVPESKNLCINGDFEDGLTGWTVNYDINGFKEYTEKDGNKCALISARWNIASGIKTTIQGDFKEGQTLTYTYSIKRAEEYKGDEFNYFGINFEYNTDTESPVHDYSIVPDNGMLYGNMTEWTTAYGQYIVKADTSYIDLTINEVLWGHDGLDFYIDNIAVITDDMAITVPRDRAVYQRDSENKADVLVNVKYDPGYDVCARLVENDRELSSWEKLKDSDGLYSGTIHDVPAGGWYKLEVQALDKSTKKVVAAAGVERVGVGEVFITGGQSNSCNFGQVKMAAKEDIVSAYDATLGIWKHCFDPQPNNSGGGGIDGSPWPAFGDEMVSLTKVPIGMVSTGYGGRTIKQILTENYDPIKEAINSLKPYGFRAFLIHQGEADVLTDREAYKKDYIALINKSRADAGFDLPWIVAKVSYPCGADLMKTLNEAQKAICNNYDIFEGPTTDDMTEEYRREDNIHFNEKGLIEHGKRWANVVINKLCTPYTISTDSGMSHGTIAQSGEQFYATNMVTLTPVPDEGYKYVEGSLKVNNGEFALNGTTFKMPAEDVTVKAEFVKE